MNMPSCVHRWQVESAPIGGGYPAVCVRCHVQTNFPAQFEVDFQSGFATPGRPRLKVVKSRQGTLDYESSLIRNGLYDGKRFAK